MKVDERGFEDAITASLVEQGGYRVCKWGTKPEWAADFDRARGLDMAELFGLIEETQPKAWERLVAVHGGTDGARQQFADRLAKQIDERGTVDVLRHGVNDHGIEVRLAFFKPAHGLTPALTTLYFANRLTVTRQLPFDAARRARPSGAAAALLRLAHRAHGLLARLAGDAVEDQDPVEMVDLVLDHARDEPVGLDLQLLSRLVHGADANACRALDLDVDPRQAQASLHARLELLAAPLHDGVHERSQRILLVGLEDEHAMEHTHLVGGEADAERVVHQLAHPRHLRAQPLVEALDGQRARAQHRVAELAHMAQGGVAAGARLGIELRDGGGVLEGLYLDVVILGDGDRQLFDLRALGRHRS